MNGIFPGKIFLGKIFRLDNFDTSLLHFRHSTFGDTMPGQLRLIDAKGEPPWPT